MPSLGLAISDVRLAAYSLVFLVSAFHALLGLLIIAYAHFLSNFEGAPFAAITTLPFYFGNFSPAVNFTPVVHMTFLFAVHGAAYGWIVGRVLERWRWSWDAAVSGHAVYFVAGLGVNGAPSAAIVFVTAVSLGASLLVSRPVALRYELAEISFAPPIQATASAASSSTAGQPGLDSTASKSKPPLGWRSNA